MIIVHRCSCGHPDIYHRGSDPNGDCSYGTCQATRHEFGPPEVIPTFADGKVNEYLFAPGDAESGYKLCACEECGALYERENTGAPMSYAWHDQRAASGMEDR